MGDPSISSGGPKFRITQGRGLGERRSPAPNVGSPAQNSLHHRVLHQGQSNASPQMHGSRPGTSMSPMPMPTDNSHLQQQPHHGAGPPPMGPGVSGHVPSGPMASSEEQMNMINKCVRFFKTLMQLSQQPSEQPNMGRDPSTHSRVRELVAEVIFGNMPADEFTTRLQEALNSQAQPHLEPFLQKTLPLLRQAIRNGDVSIDGIQPPPGMAPPQNIPHGPGSVPPMGHPIHPGPSPQQPQMHQGPSPQMHQGPSPQMHQGPSPQQPQMHQGPSPQQPQMHQGPSPQQQPMRIPSIPIKTEPIKMEVNTNAPPAPAVQPSSQEEDVIQVRQFHESALQSSLLRPEDIMAKITNRMNEACYVEEDVLTLISDAAEYRIRDILGEVAMLAEHRVDPLRLNPNYQQIDDPRTQLRFIEQVDRNQVDQRANREKEALIRLSKSKNIGKDTLDRAKEVQRAEAEAQRNRDANVAAMTALGKNVGRNKFDQFGPSTGGAVVRPRTVRVNLRDLHALMSNDPRCARTQLLHKLSLLGPPAESL